MVRLLSEITLIAESLDVARIKISHELPGAGGIVLGIRAMIRCIPMRQWRAIKCKAALQALDRRIELFVADDFVNED